MYLCTDGLKSYQCKNDSCCCNISSSVNSNFSDFFMFSRLWLMRMTFYNFGWFLQFSNPRFNLFFIIYTTHHILSFYWAWGLVAAVITEDQVNSCFFFLLLLFLVLFIYLFIFSVVESSLPVCLDLILISEFSFYLKEFCYLSLFVTPWWILSLE